MMAYKIVIGSGPVALEKMVAQMLPVGWRPLGGPCTFGGEGLILQAMTREEKPDVGKPHRS